MSRGAALSLVRLISGVIRVKVVALALGVGGVGIFSLAQQVNITAVSVVGLGLAVPIINLGRPSIAAARFADAGQVAGSALAILALNIAVLIVAGLIAGPSLMQSYGQSDQWLLWALIAAIILGAAASSFWEGLSYLSDRFDIYTKAGIASALADMVFIAFGAWAYGLRGAVLALPAGPLVLFLAYALLLRRDRLAQPVLRNLTFSASQLPRLLSYSAMMFAAVALTNVGLTVARTSVLLSAGPAANGGLQTATSLSAYILAFVTTGFWGHLHARAAADGDTAEVRAELHHALDRGLLMSFTGCGLAIVLADYLLPLFFSSQFISAASLLAVYMPGEFCFQFLTLLISYQLTVSLRRRYLAWSLAYVALLVPIALASIPRFGSMGFVAGHATGSIIALGLAGFLCWKRGQVRCSLILRAAMLLSILIGTSVFMLLLRDRIGPWSLLAVLPFVASGARVSWQLLQGFGLIRQPQDA